MEERIILHVDMDSFFTSIEAKENSLLKNRPIIVGADPKDGKGRGVVSACSYEARKFGVHSAMPISKAFRLCPNAVFMPVNFQLYTRVSENIMEILRGFANKFEQVSIDEAYLDVTKSARSFSSAIAIAKQIRKQVAAEGLTCSIGIAPNKIVAKMASDFEKPSGITVVLPHEVKQFLYPLPVRKLHGVGKVTETRLKELGIETVADLAMFNVQRLVSCLGKWGLYLHMIANGIDESEVEESYSCKSVSREITFESDIDDFLALDEAIDKMADDIHEELEIGDYTFRTVGIKIRFDNFETHIRQRTMPYQSSDIEVISRVSKQLIKKFLGSKKKIRLVGIKLGNLKEQREQKNLREYYAKLMRY